VTREEAQKLGWTEKTVTSWQVINQERWCAKVYWHIEAWFVDIYRPDAMYSESRGFDSEPEALGWASKRLGLTP